MMQNLKNTYIQIKQNIFALKRLSYIQQLYIYAASRKLYLFNFKHGRWETLVPSIRSLTEIKLFKPIAGVCWFVFMKSYFPYCMPRFDLDDVLSFLISFRYDLLLPFCLSIPHSSDCGRVN